MTLTNMMAADELFLIRAEITRLERREAELRAGFLTGRLPVQGFSARVEVRQQVRRNFCKDRLPSAVLRDPGMWEEKVVLAVVVQRQARIDLRTG